jgi:ELWxxDGT repeat protein
VRRGHVIQENTDNTLFFVEGDAEHGRELWRNDGTAEGTYLLEEPEPGPAGSSPRQLTAGISGSLFIQPTVRRLCCARPSFGEGLCQKFPSGAVMKGEKRGPYTW